MIGDNIRFLRKQAGYSQEQLARKLGITQGAISLWEKGNTNPDTGMLVKIAQLFDQPIEFFLSDEPRRDLDSIRVIRNAIPIVGEIACGNLMVAEPSAADEYTDLPEGVHADFALRCKGDSMAPTFQDGDLVLIRKQPEVENGQIAAVNIGGETTLKHVYRQDNGLLLVADNPAYQPVFVTQNWDEEFIIHGLAIGYIRLFS